MWNDFFDICNSTSGKRGQKNPTMASFRDSNDPRLSWLQNDFLNYFHTWKQSTCNEKTEFIATPTYHGICMLVPAIIDLVKYLLQHTTIEWVCLARISQDCLERHFSMQRAIGEANAMISV